MNWILISKITSFTTITGSLFFSLYLQSIWFLFGWIVICFFLTGIVLETNSVLESFATVIVSYIPIMLLLQIRPWVNRVYDSKYAFDASMLGIWFVSLVIVLIWINNIQGE